MPFASLLMAAALTAAGGPSAPGRAVRVRATAAVAPCVEAAARVYQTPSRRVVVETGRLADAAGADVLVGASVEVTRALEGGAAAPGSDVEVARVPWLLVVPAGNPHGVGGLADVDGARLEVWIAGGPAAHEARRAVQKLAPERLREASDGGIPRGAAAALAPLCLAGEGERLPAEVPELVVEAALSAQTPARGPARDFVDFLASPAGRRAFVSVP